MTRNHRGKTRRTRRVAFGLGRIGGPDLDRRLRAAGLVHDDAAVKDMPIDAFRAALARRIAMTINRWPGCPEPACKRARGCMAPRIQCSNARGKPMSDWARARAMARLRRQLTAKVAEDAAAAESVDAPSQKPSPARASIAAPSPHRGRGH